MSLPHTISSGTEYSICHFNLFSFVIGEKLKFWFLFLNYAHLSFFHYSLCFWLLVLVLVFEIGSGYEAEANLELGTILPQFTNY